MYTLEEIAALRQKCEELQLEKSEAPGTSLNMSIAVDVTKSSGEYSVV